MSKHICPNCNKLHEIKYGKRKLPDGTLVESKMLGFVKCEDKEFLVTLGGESVYPNKPNNVVFMENLEEDTANE